MKELYSALAKAQAEIGAAIKGSLNEAFKRGNSSGSRYADLGAVMDAVKPALVKHNIILMQTIKEGCVVTILAHPSGESIELAPVPLTPTKPDMQGYGSAITYARRYSLQTALGVPSEDDDGNAASGVGKPPIAAPADPWTPELEDAARAEAERGIEEYQAWWRKQPEAFRAPASTTEKHGKFKRRAQVVSGTTP